jgi:tetratricopeptide (TPR) repeat protein
MSTRLLERIDRQLAAAADAATRVRLLQDRAVALARFGRGDESREALAAARAQAQDGLPAWLTLRFGYVEAIQTYFARSFGVATERMREVLARARELGHGALVGECESALALFPQREGDVRSTARCARAVLANAQATAESRYRAAIVLAALLHDASLYDEARRMFDEAREAAQSMDDDIAMASLLHRAASLSAAQVRQTAARAEQDGRLVEVTIAHSDRALCLLRTGHRAAALAAAQAAQARLDEATPAEIRAIAHGNLAAVLEALGHAEQAREHATLSRIAWQAAAHEQRETRRLLAEATETVS